MVTGILARYYLDGLQSVHSYHRVRFLSVITGSGSFKSSISNHCSWLPPITHLTSNAPWHLFFTLTSESLFSSLPLPPPIKHLFSITLRSAISPKLRFLSSAPCHSPWHLFSISASVSLLSKLSSAATSPWNTDNTATSKIQYFIDKVYYSKQQLYALAGVWLSAIYYYTFQPFIFHVVMWHIEIVIHYTSVLVGITLSRFDCTLYFHVQCIHSSFFTGHPSYRRFIKEHSNLLKMLILI